MLAAPSELVPPAPSPGNSCGGVVNGGGLRGGGDCGGGLYAPSGAGDTQVNTELSALRRRNMPEPHKHSVTAAAPGADVRLVAGQEMQAAGALSAPRYVSMGHCVHTPVAPMTVPREPGWHSHVVLNTGLLSAGQATQERLLGGTTSLALHARQLLSDTCTPKPMEQVPTSGGGGLRRSLLQHLRAQETGNWIW